MKEIIMFETIKYIQLIMEDSETITESMSRIESKFKDKKFTPHPKYVELT